MADNDPGRDEDGLTASRYSQETTELLLGITADLLRSFGSAFGGRHLAIVGGLVPTLLVPEPPPDVRPHVGTGDIDLHLSVHLLDGETADYYQSIIEGFERLGLRAGSPARPKALWQWTGSHREVRVVVDLLCPASSGGESVSPASGSVAERNIGPDGQIAALGVEFGHLVPIDSVEVERRVRADVGELNFGFPVAGIVSWLCLKIDAIQRRDKAKDAFDVVWLLQALGPEVVAGRISASPVWNSGYKDRAIQQLRRLFDDQFLNLSSIGPGQYAVFLEEAGQSQLRQLAHGAVRQLGQELRRLQVL